MTSNAPKTLIDVLKHLYKMADDFPYTQLALCLDPKNLFDLLRVFGGQRLYIPTVNEFTRLIQFCIVDEIGNYAEAAAANKEVLRGFSEKSYNRMLDQIRKGTLRTKDKKGNNRGKTGKTDKGINGEVTGNSQEGSGKVGEEDE